MNMTESSFEQSAEGQQELAKADFLSRIIARIIDFIIVVALYEIIPTVGYIAAMTYLLIADGLFEGRSVGKRLIGLRVIIRDNAGAPAACGFKESIYRNSPFAVAYLLFGIFKAIPLIGWLLSFVAIAAVLIFEILVMIGSEEGMRMGDELAKTQVVQDSPGGINVS